MSKGKLVAAFRSRGRVLTNHQIDLGPFEDLDDVPVVVLQLEDSSFEIPITIANQVADLIKNAAKMGTTIQKTIDRAG